MFSYGHKYFDATGIKVVFERNIYSFMEGEGPMEVCVIATSFNSTAEIELQVAGGSATSKSHNMCMTTL